MNQMTYNKKGLPLQTKIFCVKNKIRAVFQYLIGEYYCRKFHKPVFYDIGGYGGRDIFGRKQKEYHGFWCVHCNRHWEKSGKPKPLTESQEEVCKEVFGNCWVK